MPGDPDKALQAVDQENIPLCGTRLCRPGYLASSLCRAKVRGGRCRALLFSVNVQQIRKMAGVLHNSIELLDVRALEWCSVVMDTKNGGDHRWVSITDRCPMVRLRPSKSNR